MEKHLRELWDYLRDYGAENIRIEPGGKHQKLRFDYGGIERSYLTAKLTSNNHSTQNMKATLRRMLGPSVPAEEKQPRKLEEMMDELNAHTAAVTYIGTPPVAKPSKTWRVWMCGYAAGVSTQVYLHFEDGIKQVFPNGVKIERLDDEHWKLSPGGHHRLYGKSSRVTVSYNDKQIKPFGSTKAEAVEADGALLVYLPVEKRAPVAPPKGSTPWPTQVAQPTTKPVAMPFNPQQPAPVPAALITKPAPTPPVPASLEAQMRDIIRQVQAIEATCPYHLVRLEGGRIQWRAPVIE